MHITIIDDSIDNLQVYQEYMQSDFDLKLISNPLNLGEYVTNNKTDLILLDLHMPGVSGFDLYQNKLTKSYPEIPVIFITADQSEEARIKGLNLGADDFITKPISLRELVARIKNKISKSRTEKKQPVTSIIKIDNFSLDCEMQTAEIDSKKIQLTPIEFKLIQVLAKNPNKVFPKQDLLELLWPNTYVQNQNMDTHLSNLRKKLNPFSKNIKTIKSRGYVLRI